MKRGILLAIGLGFLAFLFVVAALLGGVFQPDIESASQASFDASVAEVASGFNRPIQVTQVAGEWYVAEQGGVVRTLEGATVLDLSGVIRSGGERGLLGIVGDPNDADTLWIHASDPQGDTLVGTVQRVEGTWDPTSLETHLSLAQPYGNHNGGWIDFHADGTLWLALGDGGAAGDPQNNGQNQDTLLGSISRWDVSSGTMEPATGNPFADGSGHPAIWAYGLRNPWRAAWDGDVLWMGDVGQGSVEEINRVTYPEDAGVNFGWNHKEGPNKYGLVGSIPDGLTDPVAFYDHDGGHCSVTGGQVVRDGSALEGWYVYGDYCSGQIWAYDHASQQNLRLLDTELNIVHFERTDSGSLWIVSHDGRILELQA